MLKLIYTDLSNPCTLTHKVINKHREEIKVLEKKLTRIKAFEQALAEYLQAYGEIDYELYNCAVAWLEHSNLSISEIFQKIRE